MTTSYNSRRIYVGIDVHKKSWKVAIYTEQTSLRAFSQPPKASVLKQYLEKHFPAASYYTVYEAGFCGFEPHRALEQLGIQNMVVNPADVPTMDKERRHKDDRVDCHKLGKALRAGTLKACHVPTREEQLDRQLLRTRFQISKDLKRARTRIRSFLNLYGYDEVSSMRWSKKLINNLEHLEGPNQSFKIALDSYLDELKALIETKKKLDQAILELADTDRYKDNFHLLRTIPGIGPLSAMILLCEIGNIHRFSNINRLCSYIGLVPNTYSSGEKQHVGHITKRQVSYMRALLIQCAWRSIHADTYLLNKFELWSARMHKNKAIIRIARALIGRIYAVLKKQEAYKPTYNIC